MWALHRGLFSLLKIRPLCFRAGTREHPRPSRLRLPRRALSWPCSEGLATALFQEGPELTHLGSSLFVACTGLELMVFPGAGDAGQVSKHLFSMHKARGSMLATPPVVSSFKR